MLIGITGPAGCGKDTVGEILKETYDFQIISFAAPLKKIVCNLLGYGPEKWDDRRWRETVVSIWDCTPRHMAQTLGTEWGRRTIKDSIWMDLAFAEIEDEAIENVAVTDVRFRNEADYIRSPELGGFIIHVHRAETDALGAHKGHASEAGVGNPNTEDFHINNFGTVTDLAKQVGQVITRITQKEDDEKVPANTADTE